MPKSKRLDPGVTAFVGQAVQPKSKRLDPGVTAVAGQAVQARPLPMYNY